MGEGWVCGDVLGESDHALISSVLYIPTQLFRQDSCDIGLSSTRPLRVTFE